MLEANQQRRRVSFFNSDANDDLLQQDQHANQQQQQRHQIMPVQQCLLYDFYTVFSKGQSISQNMVHGGGSIRLDGALLLSKRYKAAIKRAVKMLEQPENNEGQSQTMVQQLGEELCSADLLWSLVESVSIRPTHNLMTIDLLEWARECFPSAQSLVPSANDNRPGEVSFLGPIMEELMQKERPELHDAYWNAVIRQALCADFPTVATLLQFHSGFKQEQALTKMVKILLAANADLFKQDRSSCEEFVRLQKKVRDLVANKQLFRAHDNLGVICSLLIGDRGTFRKYFDLFRPNWFELFPAYLLFFHPNATGEQMPKIIKNMFSLLAINEAKLSKIEQTVLAILKMDLIKALRLICSAGQSTCWLATHLVDLLHFHDPTFLGATPFADIQPKLATINESGKEQQQLANLDLRARLLLEYAQLLFRDDQLWEIGADYLMASGAPNSRAQLDRLIAHFDWHGSVSMADRLLLCDRFELHSAREEILKAVSLKFCRQGEWSSALDWALRMTSSDMAVHVARRILQGAIPASRIGQMRIFEFMADQFVTSAELVLLYKFYTFKRRLFDGELRQAVHILHELFLDNSAPIEFYVVLCDEMARILASFQRPLIGADVAMAQPATDTVPGLDRDSVQDMFLALSQLQMQQNLLKAASADEERQRQQQQRGKRDGGGRLFPDSSTLPRMEVYEQLADLMQTLRPMLAEALAACYLR